MKSRQVSTMIKQGFISDPTITFSPSRQLSRVALSPPPSSASPSKSPTLFEMMSEEQNRESRHSDAARRKLQDQVARVLADAPFRDPAWGEFGDVKLTVVSRDEFKVSMDVHRRILVEQSRFFAEKLKRDGAVSHSVEICDCDDVEIYVETVVLMYCEDLMKRLMGEEVSKVLGLLKVSDSISLSYSFPSFVFLSFSSPIPKSIKKRRK